MIELVAFLGNHGREYERNRHNVAWLLSEKPPFSSLDRQGKFKGRYAAIDRLRLGMLAAEAAAPSAAAADHMDVLTAVSSPTRLHFLWPETYMNKSGEAVQAAANFFKIGADRFLAVHDDLELPFGVVALKYSGGLGGHNGLRSLKDSLGTADFWRLRIGIGRPDHTDIALYVLSDFDEAEWPRLDSVLSGTAAALTRALVNGPETLLPEWIKKRLAE